MHGSDYLFLPLLNKFFMHYKLLRSLSTCTNRKICSLGGAPMEKNPIKAKLIWRFYPIPWASSLGDERWCWNSSCPTKYQWFWVWLFTSLKELLHWLFLVSNLTKSPQSTSLKEMFKLFANNIFCMHIKCGLPKQKAVKLLF